MTPINWRSPLTPIRGGETYRVGVTGHHKTRRGFLRPCTPHHNANVAMLNAKKPQTRLCVVMLSETPIPTTDLRLCENIALGEQNCQRAKNFRYQECIKLKRSSKNPFCKTKDFNKIRQLKTRKNGIKAPQILFFLSDTMSYCIF